MRQLQAPSKTFVTGGMSFKRPAAPAIVTSPIRKVLAQSSQRRDAIQMLLPCSVVYTSINVTSYMGTHIWVFLLAPLPLLTNMCLSLQSLNHNHMLPLLSLSKWAYLSHTTAGISPKAGRYTAASTNPSHHRIPCS